MIHCVYKITCTSEEDVRFYIGKHSTSNVEDDYVGSGVKLKDYIKSKNPKIIKEILATFDIEQDAYDYEAELVNEDWLKRPDVLNLKLGGNTAFGYSKESRDKMSKSRKGRFTGKDNPRYGVSLSPETRAKLSKAITGKPGPNIGKVWSDTSRNKMSESRKTCTGEKASRKSPVEVNGVEYSTMKLAYEAIGLNRSAFYTRLNSPKWPNYVRL
ncbi:Seg-like homing endonuclease [Erwinia phage Virsaitis27]|nr:Seg-like homing endonuclease [Erwinia phage Virsaitis27]